VISRADAGDSAESRYISLTRNGITVHRRLKRMPHNAPYAKVDEKIEKKKSIPAQIALWTVVIVLLYVFYVALGGHPL
jgi:hypothetical protein